MQNGLGERRGERKQQGNIYEIGHNNLKRTNLHMHDCTRMEMTNGYNHCATKPVHRRSVDNVTKHKNQLLNTGSTKLQENNATTLELPPDYRKCREPVQYKWKPWTDCPEVILGRNCTTCTCITSLLYWIHCSCSFPFAWVSPDERAWKYTCETENFQDVREESSGSMSEKTKVCVEVNLLFFSIHSKFAGGWFPLERRSTVQSPRKNFLTRIQAFLLIPAPNSLWTSIYNIWFHL